jgi:putative RNA 2'-phosphotransferase
MNELILALRERPKWAELTEADIMKIAEGTDKQRFQVRDGLIRARYGHSFDVTCPSEPEEPPQFLYHGTPRRAMSLIMEDGLKSSRRKYVHLSKSVKAAAEVGGRRDPQSVMVEVQAKDAHENGVHFFKATDEIYLCENVPPPYLKELSSDEATDKAASQQASSGEEPSSAS